MLIKNCGAFKENYIFKFKFNLITEVKKVDSPVKSLLQNVLKMMKHYDL